MVSWQVAWCAVALLLGGGGAGGGGAQTLEDEARLFLEGLEAEQSRQYRKQVTAQWDYHTNLTEENKDKQVKTSVDFAEYKKRTWQEVNKWKDRWPGLKDDFLRRQFKFLSILGTPALSPDKYKRLETIKGEMQAIYSTAKVCGFSIKDNCNLALEPDLTNKFRTSRNARELRHLWAQWRSQSGRKMRHLYKEYVDLSNEAAQLNGYSNMGEMWTEAYETEDFEDSMAKIWEELKPFYKELHAFVRRKLREFYGESNVSEKGPIPAHLLGNMWGQTWNNVYEIVEPYPGKGSVDITDKMKEKGMTPNEMFKLSDEFFTSLGLIPMPAAFWRNSVLEKPTDREVVCHAAAYDFYDGRDFRVKQCTRVTMEDFATVHHEMGHIQYYLQYKEQPVVFRRGANPGFHEAVGDVMALSVLTPRHLEAIGFLQEVPQDPEADMNQLMRVALSKVAFLPFGYLIDYWRWKVFKGEFEEDTWNCDWWHLRYELQGLKPPVSRHSNDFDPGAKYHVPGDTPYIRYFAAFILQFQFHKALCLRAGQYREGDPHMPLHRCDISNSPEAGRILRDMLQKGKSVHWEDTLEDMTGSREMDPQALLEYFEPLAQWLKEDNRRHGQFVGWERDEDYCTDGSAVATCLNAAVISLIVALVRLL